MRFENHIYEHNDALAFINGSRELKARYDELCMVLREITDDMIIEEFNRHRHKGIKSISDAINKLIDDGLTVKGWDRQSPIFNAPDLYTHGSTRWTLDFSCDNALAVEVAFNHGEAAAWNLIKPTLSSSINGNIQKKTNTKVGIIICATAEMKKKGNFDGAVGDYDKYIRYLLPLYAMLQKPLVIIGLEPPEKFEIIEEKRRNQVVRRDFVIYGDSMVIEDLL